MRKILYLNKELALNSHTAYGAICSMSDERIMPWIYNNMIQLRYNNNWAMLTFDEYNKIFTNCPLIEDYSCPFELLKKKRTDTIIDVIIYLIQKGYYIYVFLDRFYTQEGANEHFAHSSLIVGFDTDKKTIIMQDNLDNGKYTTVELSMEAVLKGFKSAQVASCGNVIENNEENRNRYTFLSVLSMLKYSPERYGCELSIEQICLNLEHYINSVETVDMTQEQSYIFGVKIYDFLCENIANNDKVDVRDFYVLLEHKRVMYQRIQFLKQEKYLKQDTDLEERAKRLEIQANLILRVYLKVQFLDEENKIWNKYGEVREYLQELKSEDCLLVKELLYELSRMR